MRYPKEIKLPFFWKNIYLYYLGQLSDRWWCFSYEILRGYEIFFLQHTFNTVWTLLLMDEVVFKISLAVWVPSFSKVGHYLAWCCWPHFIHRPSIWQSGFYGVLIRVQPISGTICLEGEPSFCRLWKTANSDVKSDSSKKATKGFFTSGTVWLWFRVQVSWGRGSNNYYYFPLKNVSSTCMPHLVVYSCRQQHPRNTRGYTKEKPRSSFFKDQSILYTNYMDPITSFERLGN